MSQPVAFYPYTSRVTKRLHSVSKLEGNLEFAAYEAMRTACIKKFQDAGIKAYVDNKTVFEFEGPDENPFFIGFYDGVMIMGLGVQTESDHKYTKAGEVKTAESAYMQAARERMAERKKLKEGN